MLVRQAPALASAEIWAASPPVAGTSFALREASLTRTSPLLCTSTTVQDRFFSLPPSPSACEISSTDLRKAKHKRFVLHWL